MFAWQRRFRLQITTNGFLTNAAVKTRVLSLKIWKPCLNLPKLKHLWRIPADNNWKREAALLSPSSLTCLCPDGLNLRFYFFNFLLVATALVVWDLSLKLLDFLLVLPVLCCWYDKVREIEWLVWPDIRARNVVWITAVEHQIFIQYSSRSQTL